MRYNIDTNSDTAPRPKAGIGKNTLFGMGIDVMIFGMGFVLSIVLTRSLGPEQRGIYVLLVTTNVLVSNLAHLGVATAFSTMLARGRYRLGEVSIIALLMALGIGALCLVVVSLFFPVLQSTLLHNIPYTYLFVALALVSTTIYQMYWSSMMIGANHVFLMNKVNLVVNIANTLLMVLLVGVLRLGIEGFLAGWITSAVGGFFITVWLVTRMEQQAWPPRRKTLSDLLGFGLRSHGAQVAHQIYLRFDVYVINVLIGSAGVGFYSLSTSLAEKLWIPLNAIYASSAGTIAQLPRDESALLTAKVTRTSVLLMLSLAIPFALISPWLLPLLYGPEFSVSVLPLVILLVGTLGFSVMMMVNTYILGQMERPGLLSMLAWLQLGISVPLYLALIIWQGIVGAAIASSLTYLIATATTMYTFRRDSGLPLSQALVPRLSDFADYARVIRPLVSRIPFVRRLVRPPS